MKIRSDHDPSYPVPLTFIIATSQKLPCLLSGPRTTYPLLLCHWINFAKILIVAVSFLLEPVEWFPFVPSIMSKLWDKVHSVPYEALGFLSHFYPAFSYYITTMQLLPALQHAMLSHLQSWALIFPMLRALLSFPTTLPTLSTHVHQLRPSPGITFSRKRPCYLRLHPLPEVAHIQWMTSS